MREARELGLAGVNVTHPCKQLVVPELDELSDDAEALDAVNTVVFDGDRLVGHNTDTTGFAEAFRRGLPGVATDRVVVLGAGGAGAAVAHAMKTLGARQLTVVDVDAERARRARAALGALGAARATRTARRLSRRRRPRPRDADGHGRLPGHGGAAGAAATQPLGGGGRLHAARDAAAA